MKNGIDPSSVRIDQLPDNVGAPIAAPDGYLGSRGLNPGITGFFKRLDEADGSYLSEPVKWLVFSGLSCRLVQVIKAVPPFAIAATYDAS